MADKDIQMKAKNGASWDALYPVSKAANIQIADVGNHFTAVNVEGALSELFQSVSDGKATLADVITDKGVPTSASDSFAVMSSKINSIKVATLNSFTWTSQVTPANFLGTTVAYGNGIYVALCTATTGNNLFTSPDGVNWTGRVTHYNWWTRVIFENGLFVAVCNGGPNSAPYGAMTSTDGINWTLRATPTNGTYEEWISVCYGGGLFVAVTQFGNETMSSSDGINWTLNTLATSTSWSGVGYGNGKFIVVGGNGAMCTSSNGTTWTAITPTLTISWKAIVFGNGLFVVVSSASTGSAAYRIASSPDGVTWTYRFVPNLLTLHNVCFGNNLFVVTSTSGVSNRVLTSPDGINWTMNVTPADNAWKGIIYGNGLFVATADSGGATNRVMTSNGEI
jgi:hypothetical protein